MLRPYIIDSRCAQHGPRFGIRHNRAHRRQRRDHTVVERRRASHHDGLCVAAVRNMADQAPQFDFAFVVTVQELMMARSASAGSSTTTAPFASNASRTRSVSYWLALHPNVWKYMFTVARSAPPEPS